MVEGDCKWKVCQSMHSFDIFEKASKKSEEPAKIPYFKYLNTLGPKVFT